MARAANAAAAAAIGFGEAGINDLTTSERLEPASMPAEAEALGSLQGLSERGQPGEDRKVCAEPPDSEAAGVDPHGASTAPTTPMPEELPSSASAAAEASAKAGAATSAADQPMPQASEPAAASAAPEQPGPLLPEGSQAAQPPEQMTQAYSTSTQDVQPPEQLTQAYAAPMEVDGGSRDERASSHDASTAQRAVQGSTGPEAADAPPALQLDGKPLVAGSAIFTKVSPMKGKVGSVASQKYCRGPPHCAWKQLQGTTYAWHASDMGTLAIAQASLLPLAGACMSATCPNILMIRTSRHTQY